MIDITKKPDTNSKHYQSPIRFFETYNINYNIAIASKAIFLADHIQEVYKKTSDKIEIEGFIYSEQELIDELRLPDFEKRLVHHITIWERKWLLRFLEEGTLLLRDATRHRDALAGDPDFVEFISPYFVTPYQHLMNQWLDQPAFESANRLLTFLSLMTDSDREKALIPVSDFFIKTTVFFNRLTFTDSKLDSLRPWTEQNWNLFMNGIPSSLYDLRNKLAEAILGFIDRICRTDLDTAFFIALRLSKLEYLDQQIAMEVHRYHQSLSDVYYKKLEAERGYNEIEEADDSPFGFLKTAIGIISVIISLVGFLSKCS